MVPDAFKQGRRFAMQAARDGSSKVTTMKFLPSGMTPVDMEWISMALWLVDCTDRKYILPNSLLAIVYQHVKCSPGPVLQSTC